MVKYLTLPIKHYKKFHNFEQVSIGEIENKMSKMKKNKKEIVNDGILLKFWISNISIFLKKKTYSFAEFVDKTSDLYNKTT